MKRVAAFALLVVAVAAAPSPAGAAGTGAATRPEIDLASTRLSPGSSVAIHGTHWPEGTTLQAVLCGANAIDGSVDCVQRAASTMTPGPSGVVDGTLNVFVPPTPCPCVVLVSGLTSSFTKRIPVDVIGAPTAPVRSASPFNAPPALQVQAKVEGGTSLASLFGGPASRTVVLKIRNTGTVPVPHPLVALVWGRSGSTDHVIPAPRVGPIAPGATRTVRASFDLDAVSIGDYEVSGRVAGAAKVVPFSGSTSTWPWGLLVIALVVLQMLLLAVRNAARRRMARQEAAAQLETIGPAPAPAPPPMPSPVSVTLHHDDLRAHDLVASSASPSASAHDGDPAPIRWSLVEPISWKASDHAVEEEARAGTPI